MEYARIRTSTNELLEIRQFGTSSPLPLSIPHKDVDWRSVVRVPYDFDADTDVRSAEVITVFADRVEITVPVRSKTANELNAEKEAMLNDVLIHGRAVRALATALFEVVNDVRALKGQQTITTAQFREYLKGLF